MDYDRPILCFRDTDDHDITVSACRLQKLVCWADRYWNFSTERRP